MAKAIWKFDVDLRGGAQQFLIPGDEAKPVLFAQQDGNKLRMWWEVQPDAESKRERIVQIVGTGHPIPDGAKHIGSVIQGAYVWHLYLVQ